MTRTMTERVTVERLTKSLINMGYGSQDSAPLIASVYLQHVYNGIPVPSKWQQETIKDAHTCYSKIYNEIN